MFQQQQQQPQNMFQPPQYDMFQQQQYGNNMMQQPQMNGMIGGKGKPPMPIIPNFFFHHN